MHADAGPARGARPVLGALGRRFRVGQWFMLTAAVLAVVGVAGIAGGLIALGRLADARSDLFDRIAPASTASRSLNDALLSEDTALRGYIITADAGFLASYRTQAVVQAKAEQQLRASIQDPQVRDVAPDFAALERRVADWQRGYAEPKLAAVRAGRAGSAAVGVREGSARFDAVRVAYARMQATVDTVRLAARARLNHEAGVVQTVFLVFGGALLLAGLLLGLVIRQAVTRPLERLSRQARGVASGEFGRAVAVDGSRDVIELGDDVERMRRRIVAELDAAQRSAAALARSNAELEQFAYVASHDLQEPLRKVEAFTKLLARRYEGQLDEKADEYIAHSVDGAQRMRTLIKELLAFSRVGRVDTDQLEPVPLQAAFDRALTDLGTRIEETGAQVTAGPLPVVRGEPGLLALVLSNLVGNAIKFQLDGIAPVVHVAAERDGPTWQISVTDNGIGIQPQHADRIFQIFQRLHGRSEYEGTGIGLAMTRKVVDYHGGTIRLDADVADGSRFVVSLPVVVGEEELRPTVRATAGAPA